MSHSLLFRTRFKSAVSSSAMASKEALEVRERLSQLTQGRIISEDDHQFWDPIWNTQLSSSEIFDLISPHELDVIRTQNHTNYNTLVTKVAKQIVSFGEKRNRTTLIACIRILTKIIPPLYHQQGYGESIEPQIFFETEPRNLQNTLGYNLMTSLIDYLFLPGFTLEENASELDLWEAGICRSFKYTTPNLVLEANRYEILKLILTLCSTTFYGDPKLMVLRGSRFLTVLVTSVQRPKLITLSASLLNVFLRWTKRNSDESMVLYDNPLLTELHYFYITSAANLLTAMLVYPLPSRTHLEFLTLPDDKRPLNTCRAFFSKFSNDQGISFMASHLIAYLRSNMLPRDQAGRMVSQPHLSTWSNLALVLLWELIQCNQHFRRYLIERDIKDLFITLFHNVFSLSNDGSEKALVQISAYFLLYMSSKKDFLMPLMEPMDTSFYESLPASYKLAMKPLTTRDFLVLQISNKLLANSLYITKSKSLITCLVEILYNLTVVIGKPGLWDTDDASKRLSNYNSNGGLSYGASLLLCQVVTKFSEKSFLVQDSVHADLLAIVLRAICTAALKYPVPSRMLILTILKNEKLYDHVWNIIQTIENDEPDTTEKEVDYFNDSETESLPSQTPGDTFNSSLFIADTTQSPTPDTDFGPGPLDRSRTNPGGFDEESILDALRPHPLTGMSKRAREKQPMARPLHRTWAGNDPLHIILAVLVPYLKLELADLWIKQGNEDRKLNLNSFTVMNRLEKVDFGSMLSAASVSTDYLPDTSLPMLVFSWNKISLAWYISLVQSECYNSEEYVRNYLGNFGKLSKTIALSLTSIGRFASGLSGFAKPVLQPSDSEAVNSHVTDALTTTNQWARTDISSFQVEQPQATGLFGALAAKVGFGSSPQAVPGSPGANDMSHTLVRRISDLRLSNSSRTSVSSIASGLSTPQEEQVPAFPKLQSRNSVSSLHSLNTLNRSRSNTPRNSISL